MKKSILILFFIFSPIISLAHQPKIVNDESTKIIDPEISKAYYSELSGEPHVYTINEPEEFDLYVGILVPDIDNVKKDVKAELFKEGESIKILGGLDSNWTMFFEPFGQSTYWDGGEYKGLGEVGEYKIVVSSINNDSKYSLAVGEIEDFSGSTGLEALSLIPKLKEDFFNESPISFIKSTFGWGLIVVMYTLSIIFGFSYRAILKKTSKGTVRGASKNMGKKDRILRILIGIVLLLWAITNTWSPILIFFSGFAFFEAIFSWCGFYAAIGKNSCPID